MAENSPPIGIGTELDLTGFFTGVDKMEARLVEVAKKVNSVLASFAAADPDSVKNFEQSLTALSTQVIQSTDNAIKGIVNSASAAIRQVLGEAKSGGTVGAPGTPGASPITSGIEDANKRLQGTLDANPVVRMREELQILATTLQLTLPAAASVLNKSLGQIEAAFKTDKTTIEQTNAALLELKRTQDSLGTIRTDIQAQQLANRKATENPANTSEDLDRLAGQASILKNQLNAVTVAINGLGNAQKGLRTEAGATQTVLKTEAAQLKEIEDISSRSSKARVEQEHRVRDAIKEATTEVNRQARAYSKDLQPAISSTALESRGLRDNFLAILAVSRFLPSGLSQITSGLALMEGASRTSSALLLGIAGAAAAAVIQLGLLGAKFNADLNKERAQAEGLGLTLTEVKAFKFVLDQTGGSIENFAVGIKKINEAVTGIGNDANDTKNLLSQVFAGTGFDFTKVSNSLDKGSASKQILLELAKNVRELEKAGLASAVAAQIFGRSWDEVKGRLQDIADQEENFERAIKNAGLTSKEAEQNARDYSLAVAELDLRWQTFAKTIAGPVTSVMKTFMELTSSWRGAGRVLTGGVDPKEFDDIHEKFALAAGRNLQRLRDLGGAFSAADVKEFKKNAAIIRNFGFTEEEINKKLNDLKSAKNKEEEQKKEEQESTERNKEINEAKEKRLIEAGKGATLEQKIAAEKDITLASKQNELQLLQKERQASEKSVALADLFLQGNLSEERRAANQVLRNQGLAKLLGLRVEENKLSKEINALRTDSTDRKSRTQEQRDAATKIDEEVENIKEQLLRLPKAGEKAKEVQEQLTSVLQGRIAALAKATDDPGAAREIVTRRKALNREIEQFDNQVFSNLTRLSRQTLSEMEKDANDTIRRIEADARVSAESSLHAFEQALIPFSQVAEAEANAILLPFRAFEAEHTQIIQKIKIDIANILEDELAARSRGGGIGEDKLNDEIAAQNLKIQSEESKIGERKIATEESLRQLELSSRREFISKRQALLETEVEQLRIAADSQIKLLQRASSVSFDLERDFIEKESGLRLGIIDKQLDALLTKERDILGLKVAIDKGTGKVDVLAKDFIKNATPVQVEELVNALKAKGIDLSDEQLEILRRIVRLTAEKAEIRQNSILRSQDAELANEQKLLNIDSERLGLLQDAASAQEAMNRLLDDFNLRTPAEKIAGDIEAQRARLVLIQQQTVQLEKQARLEAQKIVTLAGPKASSSAIDIAISGDEGLARLRAQAAALAPAAEEAARRLELMDSVLTRVGDGFSHIAEVFAQGPPQFQKLAEVFKGLQKIVQAIQAIGSGKGKTSEEQIKDATADFDKKVRDSAKAFYDVITGAAKDAKSGLDENDPGVTAAAKSGTDKVKVLGDRLGKVFDIVGNAISAITSSTIGGKVSGIGSAIGGVLGLFKATAAAAPIVGAIAETAGAIFDFVGGIFKARAQKIADSIQADFKGIMTKFNTGAATLGETIGELQGALNKARQQLSSGKIGKKGGKQQLAQLEQQIGDQISQLRQKQKEIQEKFIQSLTDLQLPKDSRATAASIREAFDQVSEFMKSFDTGAEALANMGKAQEFLNLSFNELQDDAQQQLDDVIAREQDQRRQFEASLDAIKNQGRVQTEFQAAQDKLGQIFELEKKRAQDVARNLSDEGKVAATLALVRDAFNRTDNVLDKLKNTFDGLANTLNKFQNGGGFSGVGGGGLRNFDLPTQGTNSVVSGTLAISVAITGANAAEAATRTADAVEDRLTRLGLVDRRAGTFNSSRPFQ